MVVLKFSLADTVSSDIVPIPICFIPTQFLPFNAISTDMKLI